MSIKISDLPTATQVQAGDVAPIVQQGETKKLGVGTAAAANVTTSATDTTAGRLLKVGDFGVGGVETPIVTDANTQERSGFFQTGVSANNFVNNNPLIVCGRLGGERHLQIQGSNVTNTLAFRVGDNGFQPWRELYHTGNILGTVSQSAGVPTGAVIERGTGNGGEYVRYADGTQICWHRFAPTTSVGTAVNSLFRTGHTSVTFAAAFAEGTLPSVTATIQDQATFNLWVQATRNTSRTSTTVQLLSTVSNPDFTDVTVNIIAVGRWY